MSAAATSAATKSTTHPPKMFPHEVIASRAYQLWEREGRGHGRDQEYWFRAVAELELEVARP
jgi:hypothetical protein